MGCDRADPNAACAVLPGAMPEHPFGTDTDTWKIGGKDSP